MDKTPNNLPNNRSCAACKYFDTVTNITQAKTTSICRFKPPVPFGVPMMAPSGPTMMASTLWPEVMASDWCSEFQAELH